MTSTGKTTTKGGDVIGLKLSQVFYTFIALYTSLT